MTIPKSFVHYKSSSIMNKDNVPKLFLFEHNTKAGVYGEICVLAGSLKFYGFNERRGKIEQEFIIYMGEVAVSPPEYWHKVELLSADTTFQVKFYAHKDSQIVSDNLSERNIETK
ncbi:hypothetical protein PCNPT3_11825 [Psychromonas sp. CNPT3]|uniref:DUF1971 domain-containing protein n=1 Tax=Psychromonas sp. CNPT3 TaxID=314282 RepID=UPI00006E70FD|nr:DUF1971 domain-containing protein [Psychromonas sp. CNPT3]AGH82301.1 hypothetical protein PCNPT3_11825 [Psychromonas sp. CNPT3]